MFRYYKCAKTNICLCKPISYESVHDCGGAYLDLKNAWLFDLNQTLYLLRIEGLWNIPQIFWFRVYLCCCVRCSVSRASLQLVLYVIGVFKSTHL